MNTTTFNPADPANLVALNGEVESIKGVNQVLETEIANTQTGLEKVTKQANSKIGLMPAIIGFILLLSLSVFALLKSGQPGPMGPQGLPGKDGGIVMTGPAGKDADNSAMATEIASLRKEIEAIKTKPAPAPAPVVEKPEFNQKGGMALEVDEQDGDWVVTSIDKVEKDPVLGVTMWVCKGPMGKPIVAEPGTPADFVEKYVVFKNKEGRPAGTVFKAHPRPSKRGSVVWVLVKG